MRLLCNKNRTKESEYRRKGPLVEDSIQLTTLKEFGVHSDGKKAKKRVCVEVRKLLQRYYGHCSKAGHNLHTFRQEAVIDSE
jgi:hypothetical protein